MTWEALLRQTLELAKQRLQKDYRLEDDGSGPPNFVAMRALIDKLPCPVNVVELRFDRSRHPHLQDDVCPLLIYDLSKLGTWTVEWLGVFDAYDRTTLYRVLVQERGIRAAEHFIERFQLDAMTTWSLAPETSPMSLQFLFYDPRRDPDQFAWDLTGHLRHWLDWLRPPKPQTTDYVALYNLQPEPVLPVDELLKADPRTPAFVEWKGDAIRPLSLEILQERVSRLVLIPPVPEPIHTIFKRAKDLYIFAFFRYEFFTVAEHLAALALEAAIKRRYCQTLGSTVTLQTDAGEQLVLRDPDYERIWRIMKDMKEKSRRNLMVNGEQFPATMPHLLDWLVSKGILTKWERKRCDFYRGLRNFFSHPTYAPIDLPGNSFSALAEIALRINSLFHRSVIAGSHPASNTAPAADGERE